MSFWSCGAKKEGSPIVYNGKLDPILTSIINFLRENALEFPNIFRSTGRKKNVDSLLENLSQRQNVNLHDVGTDDVTVALKHYLRDLNPPLFPFRLYNDFISLSKKVELSDFDEDSIVNTMSSIPKENLVAIKCIFEFFKDVSDNSDKNFMDSKNLGIIFAPSLIKPKKETAKNLQSNHMAIQVIISFIIIHQSTIFSKLESKVGIIQMSSVDFQKIKPQKKRKRNLSKNTMNSIDSNLKEQRQITPNPDNLDNMETNNPHDDNVENLQSNSIQENENIQNSNENIKNQKQYSKISKKTSSINSNVPQPEIHNSDFFAEDLSDFSENAGRNDFK